jgi:hypothetical protein
MNQLRAFPAYDHSHVCLYVEYGEGGIDQLLLCVDGSPDEADALADRLRDAARRVRQAQDAEQQEQAKAAQEDAA